MLSLEVKGVNEALELGMQLFMDGNFVSMRDSRNGSVLEANEPVATVYVDPTERVLLCNERDANPFFHLMESMWILAARYDVEFLNKFNSQMKEYSDDGIIFNAPYGYRLRNHFPDNHDCDMDQLQSVIDILKKDPDSRQAVAQIWDTKDLEKNTKDKACNLSLVFYNRQGKLCLTVYNRSNDMIWGAYGANMVQFSIILEYVAAKLKLPIGTYTQVSNSLHVYTTGKAGEIFNRLKDKHSNTQGELYYPTIPERVLMNANQMDEFEHDLKYFFNLIDGYASDITVKFKSDYFNDLIVPTFISHKAFKEGKYTEAIELAQNVVALDWRAAMTNWLCKRQLAAEAKRGSV